jgi:hypothetical protein
MKKNRNRNAPKILDVLNSVGGTFHFSEEEVLSLKNDPILPSPTLNNRRGHRVTSSTGEIFSVRSNGFEQWLESTGTFHDVLEPRLSEPEVDETLYWL